MSRSLPGGFCLLLFCFMLPPTAVNAAHLDEDSACHRTILLLQQKGELSEKAEDYYCNDFSIRSPGYLTFALRTTLAPPGAPKDWVGSNLGGWYAVRHKDGAVFKWDMGADEPGKRLSSPRQKKRNHSSSGKGR